jgi:Tfp pilus assembly protein PilV
MVKKTEGEKGLTLVELMVAALLLGLAITGVMSMLGAGRAVETDKILQRQATLLAADTLEDPQYAAVNYPLAVRNSPYTVALSTGTGHSIPATLTVMVQDASTEWNDGNGGASISVPHQTMAVQVQWTAPGTSKTESVVLRKSIADLD